MKPAANGVAAVATKPKRRSMQGKKTLAAGGTAAGAIEPKRRSTQGAKTSASSGVAAGAMEPKHSTTHKVTQVKGARARNRAPNRGMAAKTGVQKPRKKGKLAVEKVRGRGAPKANMAEETGGSDSDEVALDKLNDRELGHLQAAAFPRVTTVPAPAATTAPAPAATTAPAPATSAPERKINNPRPPTKTMIIYQIDHYQRYDPKVHGKLAAAKGGFKTFAQYDAYRLYVNPVSESAADFPCVGVRLDDLSAARALAQCKQRKLNECWPAEFDNKGMIQASRVPLGLAAKMWVSAEDVDVDGKAAGAGEGGWHYRWWRGLHCLMGEEGYKAGMYLTRLSHKKFKCEGFGFKIGFCAVVQALEGA